MEMNLIRSKLKNIFMACYALYSAVLIYGDLWSEEGGSNDSSIRKRETVNFSVSSR
jgi:hypothetical protein